MGATPSQQDMFVEVNGMQAPTGTMYGAWDATSDAQAALTNKMCAPFNASATPPIYFGDHDQASTTTYQPQTP